MKLFIPMLKNYMALKLNKPYSNKDELITMLDDIYPEVNVEAFFHTLIFRFINEKELITSDINIQKELIIKNMETFFNQHDIQCMFGFKDHNHLIIHISYEHIDKHLFNNLFLDSVYNTISQNIPPHVTAYMAVGQRVNNIFNIPVSYNSSVIALQKIFFNPVSKILTYDKEHANIYHFDNNLLLNFSDLIYQGNKDKAIFFIKKLSADLRIYDGTLDREVRHFYFKFLLELIIINASSGREYLLDRENIDIMWESILNFTYLDQVENFIIEKIEDYFNLFYKLKSTNVTADDIIRYIHTNYTDPDLSLKKISQVTFLSPPYICVMFKKETGKTLVQYITKFRIEKSIEYLKNKFLKVNDIANRVGFNDGNYYAKSFKKVMGISPSEYREKYLNEKEHNVS